MPFSNSRLFWQMFHILKADEPTISNSSSFLFLRITSNSSYSGNECTRKRKGRSAGLFSQILDLFMTLGLWVSLKAKYSHSIPVSHHLQTTTTNHTTTFCGISIQNFVFKSNLIILFIVVQQLSEIIYELKLTCCTQLWFYVFIFFIFYEIDLPCLSPLFTSYPTTNRF